MIYEKIEVSGRPLYAIIPYEGCNKDLIKYTYYCPAAEEYFAVMNASQVKGYKCEDE